MAKTTDGPWYAAKALFLHLELGKRSGLPCYEERITLVRARSEAEALRKGETEARRYARSLDGTKYLGFITIYHLYDTVVRDGTEIYSIMRSLPLSPREFVDVHYDDGTFHARTLRKKRSRNRSR